MTIQHKDATPHWDAVAATKNGSGFQVLLDGAASHECQVLSLGHQLLRCDHQRPGWKTAAQATELGWETKFNSDLNGDGITGASVKDDNNDGFVDGSSPSTTSLIVANQSSCQQLRHHLLRCIKVALGCRGTYQERFWFPSPP